MTGTEASKAVSSARPNERAARAEASFVDGHPCVRYQADGIEGAFQRWLRMAASRPASGPTPTSPFDP